MSLPDPNNPQTAPTEPPTAADQPAPETSLPQTETSKKPQKTNELYLKALKVAENYKDKSWGSAKADIMREAGCSKSTAYRAHREAQGNEKKAACDKGAKTPRLNIEKEQPKNPQNISTGGTIEELPDTPTDTTQAPTGTQQPPLVDPSYFQDMLRGIHDLLLSKDGILGDKYGRPKEQIHATSDMLARYLSRRISPEQLEQYDTAFLVLGYASLVVPILNDIRKDRAKKTEKAAAR